jgi:hypothetical protein
MTLPDEAEPGRAAAKIAVGVAMRKIQVENSAMPGPIVR